MEKKKKNISSTILQIVGARPILFNPLFAKKPSTIPHAVFLSQMLYWQSTRTSKVESEKWFYKSVDEFEEETGLSAFQQRNAIEFWGNYGIINTELRGVPPKRWFFVDIESVLAFVNSTNSRSIRARKNGEEYVGYFEDLDKMYGFDRPLVKELNPNCEGT